MLHVGIRFPLGVASAGLAILSHLPAAEVDAFFERVRPGFGVGSRHNEDAIQAVSGHPSHGVRGEPALIVEGGWGLGAAVFDRSGRPAWALSLTGSRPASSPSAATNWASCSWAGTCVVRQVTQA